MDLKNIKTLEELKLAKHKFYAPDSEYTKLQKQIRTAPNDQKRVIGQQIAKMRSNAETAFSNKMKEIEQAIINEKINSEYYDVTRPLIDDVATLHPLTLIIQKFKNWFSANGYYQVEGSEIENDKYNFEMLNIASDHPARDMQDSLYIDKKKLLRTHNTGFSIRELEKNKNKSFSQYSIGNVYRNDEDDRTHSHQFMQLDFVSVGDMNLSNLIFTIKSLLNYVFESEQTIRLRPSFFPFTEPSVEIDIQYNGEWIEILGAGMLHPNVLKNAGYTNGMKAIAAGIGIERIAMIKYGIKDIREFYKNDIRFLRQFKGVR